MRRLLDATKVPWRDVLKAHLEHDGMLRFWHRTPWHDWRRWIGYVWRREVDDYEVYDPRWEYETERGLARRHLRESFDA
jgi:hypothetical protein